VLPRAFTARRLGRLLELELPEFAPGDTVVEIATDIAWKVLAIDAGRSLVTCEHSGPRRHLIRTIPARELRAVEKD
jgi:hypothetical protein